MEEKHRPKIINKADNEFRVTDHLPPRLVKEL